MTLDMFGAFIAITIGICFIQTTLIIRFEKITEKLDKIYNQLKERKND